MGGAKQTTMDKGRKLANQGVVRRDIKHLLGVVTPGGTASRTAGRRDHKRKEERLNRR
jgi:hypothetical protein